MFSQDALSKAYPKCKLVRLPLIPRLQKAGFNCFPNHPPTHPCMYTYSRWPFLFRIVPQEECKLSLPSLSTHLSTLSINHSMPSSCFIHRGRPPTRPIYRLLWDNSLVSLTWRVAMNRTLDWILWSLSFEETPRPLEEHSRPLPLAMTKSIVPAKDLCTNQLYYKKWSLMPGHSNMFSP